MDKDKFYTSKKIQIKCIEHNNKTKPHPSCGKKIIWRKFIALPLGFGYYDDRSSEGGWQTMMHGAVAGIALLYIFMCLGQNYVSCNVCKTLYFGLLAF